MLENYLKNCVKIYIRSTYNTIDMAEGIVTNVTNKFIELDNKQLINIDSIVKIVVK